MVVLRRKLDPERRGAHSGASAHKPTDAYDASTIQEAFELGTFPDDIRLDYASRLIKLNAENCTANVKLPTADAGSVDIPILH